MTQVDNILDFPSTLSCKVCEVEQPVKNFQWQKGCIASKCHECNKAARREYHKKRWAENPEHRAQKSVKHKEWQSKNPDPRRNRDRPDRLKRLYGIENYAEVLKAYEYQMGLCANTACSLEISLDVKGGRNRAVIDHDHKTGKFRELLCSQCNLELGKIEKDKKLVLGLFAYLRKHTKLNKNKE